jgi:hypothetical protein
MRLYPNDDHILTGWEFVVSINDPIYVRHHKKHGYYLAQGRETFYNEKREWITFDTPEEARQWAIKNLGKEPEVEQGDLL